jgi:small subunit ribosomal protein S26e
VRSAKPGAINSRKNRAPPPRAIFKDGKVSYFHFA